MSMLNSVPVKLTAWAISLCPLMLAVAFHTGWRSVPLSIKSTELPALAFRQYAVDLRKVKLENEILGTFLFQNRGTEPVQIVKLEPSCHCLSPKLQGGRNNTIEPGDQGRIVVRMDPGNTRPGPHLYTVTVKYSDPQPREAQLVFKVEIPPTLWVTPPSLAFYHPRGSTPTKQEFTVTDGRGQRFDITDVSIDTDLVETAIGESSRTPSGNHQQKINIVVAGNLPPGMTQHTLLIKTTDPLISELKVPIRLEGEADPVENVGDSLDHQTEKSEAEVAGSRKDE